MPAAEYIRKLKKNVLDLDSAIIVMLLDGYLTFDTIETYCNYSWAD